MNKLLVHPKRDEKLSLFFFVCKLTYLIIIILFVIKIIPKFRLNLKLSIMNIAKALKTKNTLLKEIGVLSQRIARHNSSIVGAENPYDTRVLLGDLQDRINQLLALKTALNIVNAPIQGSIYRLSELKSLIIKLKGVNTQAGIVPGGRYSESAVATEYKAQITTLELDVLIEGYEEEIDTLQETIDQFNYTTQVEIK